MPKGTEADIVSGRAQIRTQNVRLQRKCKAPRERA